MVGSLGLAPGANIGADVAMFEATHGSAPDITGKGICNPISLVLSGAAMLGHAGKSEASRRIEESVHAVLTRGVVLTPDLGGNATTAQMVNEIIEQMKAR